MGGWTAASSGGHQARFCLEPSLYLATMMDHGWRRSVRYRTGPEKTTAPTAPFFLSLNFASCGHVGLSPSSAFLFPLPRKPFASLCAWEQHPPYNLLAPVTPVPRAGPDSEWVLSAPHRNKGVCGRSEGVSGGITEPSLKVHT